MNFSAADLAPYAVIYSVTFAKGSPRAVEISAMDFSELTDEKLAEIE